MERCTNSTRFVRRSTRQAPQFAAESRPVVNSRRSHACRRPTVQPPHRRSRRRKRHADEVRVAEGAAPRRRSTANRSRSGGSRATCPRFDNLLLLVIRPNSCRRTWRTGPFKRQSRNRSSGPDTHSCRRSRFWRERQARCSCSLATSRCCAPATVQALVAHHVARGAAATVLTATVPDPAGYGRIVRKDGAISAIVEHKDASADERAIAEINSGVYAFDLAPLFAGTAADWVVERAGGVLSS